MMMTVDEKLHAYAKNQKDRNIDEKKLQQTIIKSKEAYWDGEIERNMSWLEFLYQQASYIQKHWWFAQGAVLLILLIFCIRMQFFINCHHHFLSPR